MAKLQITTTGTPSDFIVKFLSDMGKKDFANIKEAKFILEQDIDFLVCDLKECHGNINNSGAWLCNDNFSTEIIIIK